MNPYFMGSRRSDFYLLQLEGFTCTPANSGFALDCFSSSVRHGGGKGKRRGIYYCLTKILGNNSDRKS